MCKQAGLRKGGIMTRCVGAGMADVDTRECVAPGKLTHPQVGGDRGVTDGGRGGEGEGPGWDKCANTGHRGQGDKELR